MGQYLFIALSHNTLHTFKHHQEVDVPLRKTGKNLIFGVVVKNELWKLRRNCFPEMTKQHTGHYDTSAIHRRAPAHTRTNLSRPGKRLWKRCCSVQWSAELTPWWVIALRMLRFLGELDLLHCRHLFITINNFLSATYMQKIAHKYVDYFLYGTGALDGEQHKSSDDETPKAGDLCD